MARPVLAVIPARGGSKGLPGKNLVPLAGLPLIAHSIRCAQATAAVDRLVVSTDSDEIAAAARAYGADAPFRRPAELATDTAAMWPVVRHALTAVEALDGRAYGSVLLLDPTSPGRLPGDITSALDVLESDETCDGVIGVSEPPFNPLWHCVVEENGYLRDLVPGASRFVRRQDVPPVYRINATLYLWRRRLVLGADDWRGGRLRAQVTPENRSFHIDDAEQLAHANAALESGVVRLPWLS
jgi:CMP-N,N'-diacetyllegionaminic acid synthase